MSLSLKRVVVLIAGIGFLSIFFAGIYSDPYLADEVFHYRLAGYIYDLGAIPAYDPLLHTNPLTGKNYYVNEPLWHCLLAIFWTLTGHSQLTGQLFQAIIYLGLVYVTFLLGRELYGLEGGYYAALLTASAPLVILYSILFHVDLFCMLLCALCYLMVLRKRWLWVGVILGLAFVAKRNSYFIAPAVTFCVLYYSEGPLRGKLRNLFIFLIALSVTVAPDMYRRHTTFSLYGVGDNKQAGPMAPLTGQDKQIPLAPTHPETTTPAKKPIPSIESKRPLVVDMPERYTPRLEGGLMVKIHDMLMLGVQPRELKYERVQSADGKCEGENGHLPVVFIHPEDIFIPRTIPTYLGGPLITVFIVAIVYIFLKGKRVNWFDRRYILIYATVPMFLAAFFICFLNDWGMRYMGPILVFAFVAGGNAFSHLKGGWRDYVRYLLVAICVVQIIITSHYVQQHRRITPGKKEAYEYAKRHLLDGSLTLCCMGAFPLYTGKPMLWHSNAAPIELDYIFWDASEKQVKEILGKFHVKYLFVDKDRTYDDSRIRHVLGYPRSFIARLNTFDSMKLIFDNKDVAIWEIM